MDQLNKAHDDGVVLGLAGVAGVAKRLDIDVMLFTQPDTFNLFIIALLELQGKTVPWKTDPGYTFTSDDKMSWFQLAGIHGLPAEDWDGVVKSERPMTGDKVEDAKRKASTAFKGGYCAHGTPTFPCWHRPYLALLEQTLLRQVANVAKRFSESPAISDVDKKAYAAAAKQFRLPYWDYYRPRDYDVSVAGPARGGGGGGGRSETMMLPFDYRAPQIFTLPEVMIRRLPDNKLVNIANPFFQFEFGDAAGRIDWASSGLDKKGIYPELRKRTLRHGGAEQANFAKMNAVLNKVREDQLRASLVMIEDGVYNNFNVFAYSGVPVEQRPKNVLNRPTGSLEALHGGYHVYVGGFSGDGNDRNMTGSMSVVPVAAFDPLFAIHDTQIDRLYAIWQASNGEKHWFEETEPKNQYLKDFDMAPFRKGRRAAKGAKQDFWNPTTARDTTVFGYTYPETEGRELGRDAGQADQLRTEFAAKYTWSRRLEAGQETGSPPDDMVPLPIEEAQVFKYSAGVESAGFFKKVGRRDRTKPKMAARTATAAVSSSSSSAKTKVSQEWYIDVVVERMAANGSYTIFYIIGDDAAGDSGQDWSALPGFAGVSHIFTAPREACDNCGRQEEQAVHVTATTPVTSLLLDYVKAGQLGSMEPEDVEPFLVKKLKWRVQSVGGAVIDPRVLDRDHTLQLGISLKTAPMPGQEGTVEYSFYPQIIEQIIANASPSMTARST